MTASFTEPKDLQLQDSRTSGLYFSMEKFQRKKQMKKKSFQKIQNKGILKIINTLCLQIVHFGKDY